MADEYLNIDLVFRNGLRDYEALPPKKGWESVKTAVAGRKAAGLRLLSGRTAAVVLALISAGSLVIIIQSILSGKIGDKPAITLNQEIMPDGEMISRNGEQNINNPGPAQHSLLKAGTLPVPMQEEKIMDQQEKFTVAFSATLFPGETHIPQRTIMPTRANPVTELQRAVPAGREFVLNGTDLTGSKDENVKWKLGAAILPAYYSKFSFGSHDAAREYIREEDLAFSYSGGFAVAFGLSQRFSVRTGLVLNNMGQRIEGITAFSGFGKYSDAKSTSDFVIRTAAGTINAENKDIYFIDNRNISRVLTLYTTEVFDPGKAELMYINNSLIQNLKYLELPVWLRYKLIDRNIDISMSGGISYNVLVGNTSYVQSEGVKYVIGKTTGLSPVTFSSSLGLGVEYNVSEAITVSFEPVFRYYITPLGGVTGSSIHPYSFGILSGFFYNF